MSKEKCRENFESLLKKKIGAAPTRRSLHAVTKVTGEGHQEGEKRLLIAHGLGDPNEG